MAHSLPHMGAKGFIYGRNKSVSSSSNDSTPKKMSKCKYKEGSGRCTTDEGNQQNGDIMTKFIFADWRAKLTRSRHEIIKRENLIHFQVEYCPSKEARRRNIISLERLEFSKEIKIKEHIGLTSYITQQILVL